MINFVKPEFTLLSNYQNKNENHVKFLVDPVESGFAITLGNALRRTLLSTTPGPAIFGVKITGASHEFDVISGVKENIARIILNIKDLILKVDDSFYENKSVFELELSSNGDKKILFSKDILPYEGIEVVNKNLIIANLIKGTRISMVLYGTVDSGYRTFKENKKYCKDISLDVISIDSNFSPIKNINYFFEDTKVGKTKKLEKLIFNIETNGSMSAVKAMSFASNVLIQHLLYFSFLDKQFKDAQIFKESELKELKVPKNETIFSLNLSQRALNCLTTANIIRLVDLTSRTEKEIKKIKNLGKKSFLEIKQKISNLGLKFKL